MGGKPASNSLRWEKQVKFYGELREDRPKASFIGGLGYGFTICFI